MNTQLTRERAWEILTRYNKEEFHQKHALVLEHVMAWFAADMGLAPEEVTYWSLVGLLHDVDFEQYPEQHCIKAPELLRAEGVEEPLIRSIISHAYGTHTDVAPEHPMEKVLFAVDELTGLIGAVAIMRPSKSTLDLELKSVKKKFKQTSFAAGCSREIISTGAERMGISLDELITKTIEALRSLEREKGIV